MSQCDMTILLQELFSIARKISDMNHNWRVPNLPKVYYDPMEKLEDIVFKIENLKTERENESN